LLIQINEKLELGLSMNKINLCSVNAKLNEKYENHDILDELNKLVSKYDSWFWLVNELRNHTNHRAMLNYQVSMSIIEDVNINASKNTKPVACFLINPLDNKKSNG
jgi:hypothetical protein